MEPNKQTHHFKDRDQMHTYMMRCIPRQVNVGMNRVEAIGVCRTQYFSKIIKKK